MTTSTLLEAIAQVGRDNPSRPALREIEIFRHYFSADAQLKINELDLRDGSCTRRELILRYLLLDAVLDQGPDTEGVRLLLVRVTNGLYLNEIRFLHQPSEFFRDLGITIDQITSTHEAVKQLRAENWARSNESSASRYSLFMENAKQALGYTVFRWGVPLAVPLVLVKDQTEEQKKTTALLDYLLRWPSAEEMSQQLKDHPRYGLGKAIGDKAAHLFAKWIIHSYPLITRENDQGWGRFSFEVPFDSNAGRVLFRTGFFLEWASLNDYVKWQVIQKGTGKGGKDYVRVTNIRGKKSKLALKDRGLFDAYRKLCADHLKTHKNAPKSVEIQRIPLAVLLQSAKYTPGELDDGLMYIGTNYCFNHSNPLCSKCPVRKLCRANQEDRRLIEDYRT